MAAKRKTKTPPPTEWYALWRFKTTEDAIKSLEEMHISMGRGDSQYLGCIADNLEDGEVVTITSAGGMVEVCLSFPYKSLRGRDAWISPCQIEHVKTYDLAGKENGGDSYDWGSR